MNFDQKLAVAKLIGCLEGIAESGIFREETEMQLREIIAEALTVFGLPSKAELTMPRAVQ